MFALSWLADVLRAAGLNVVEQPGWQTRGRGEMGTVKGVICHHTGPGSTAGLLDLVKNGRSDLPGPLSQLFLDRDGTFHVVAAGRCNHAGAGRWQGVTAGNTEMIGIEARNAGDGHDPWPEPQIEAYARGCAAILIRVHADSVMCAGHKEYALPRGRKIDPSFDMPGFRDRVEAYMTADDHRIVEPSTFPVPAADPARAMLRKGDQGNSVRELQRLLGITQDGAFGPATETAVKAFQDAHGLAADGRVGPKTWAALGVTNNG
jgi:N-acetyl-anhydromuramyl-L-alanine amidase AmpD